MESQDKVIDKRGAVPTHLAYPVFQGNNKELTAKINKWINQIWDKDVGCGLFDPNQGSGSYSRDLKVIKLSTAVLVVSDGSDVYCPGAAYPDEGMSQRFIDLKKDQEVNMEDLLTGKARTDLLKKLSALGKATRSRDDGCAQAYEMDSLLPTPLEFSYEENGLAIEPSFIHAIQACTKTLHINKTEAVQLLQKSPFVETLFEP